MKHRIDPKVDCVFKALLGSEVNRTLLIHFLNAMLTDEFASPIAEVEILNPYNEREFLDDKLSIVDVKARDGAGRMFQVEIQLLSYHNLPARMIYNWADIHSQQLESGQDYHLLKPTYAVWLLAEDLVADGNYAHDYKLRDRQGQTLAEYGGIWALELNKFSAERIDTEAQRWLKFFKEGGQLDDECLPDWMQTQEMRQAMGTLKQFSEKERDYHAYQARQNFLRQQRTMEWERDQERLEKLEALRQKEEALQREATAVREKETAIQEKEAAMRELEQLKALLGKTGQ